jgi:hypothetical protein
MKSFALWALMACHPAHPDEPQHWTVAGTYSTHAECSKHLHTGLACFGASTVYELQQKVPAVKCDHPWPLTRSR